MTGRDAIDEGHGLKTRVMKRIWPRMSLRPLFAMLIAAAMLFAPFAMQAGGAMAMAPADHQSQMTESGKCGDQPAKERDGKGVEKPCCIAMCTAIAVAPVSPAAPVVFPRSVEQPSLEQFSHGYLAKLPTPPPRGA